MEILIGLFLFLCVTFLVREVVMWYWKINIMLDNQDRTNALLARQNELLEIMVRLLKS